MKGNDAFRGEPEAVDTLRILTFNLGLLGFKLKNRWRMPVDAHSGERLAAAPRLLSSLEADIIALQEVYSPTDREVLARAMAELYPFQAGSPKMRSLVGNGLMLLSRFPILHSAFMPCRGSPRWTLPFWKQGLLAVELDLPSIGRTRLIDAHIAASVPFGDANSMASKANRNREIDQLLSAANAGEVTAILAGDFNTSPAIHPEHYDRIISAGYVDAFVASNPPAAKDGFTWDCANPLNARGRFRHAPSQRIDHVFVRGGHSAPLKPVAAEIVLQDRVVQTASGQLIPLSDHYGLLVSLALSPQRRD
ncbi:endonuclease/exonuclease/phosphatase family protein [Bradyrhizobium sp.]|uniref:endonuclease/exonuclease/phosphatase family protein n=1 Tax=Bradyrhizobium sp. TaxID=376 RepID=UPI0025C67AD2|nr:endonuclease/exonuclease/phosphatase family protein [Bradyrhizobium sp.]